MSFVDSSLKMHDNIVEVIITCPDCQGSGRQLFEFGVPDYGGWHGGSLHTEEGDCERCDGVGEIAPYDEAKWEHCQSLADQLVVFLEILADASLSSKQSPSSPKLLSKAVQKVEQCVLELVAETKNLEHLK